MKTLLAVLVVAVCAGCTCESTSNRPAQERERVKRGAQLVSIGGCNDCHTPQKFDPKLQLPVPDMTRMLSGHPGNAPDPESELLGNDQAVIGPTFTSFKLPFGIAYTANLTPDPETGTGSWNEQMFIRAVRTGRHLGAPAGRPILPPMPWPTLAAQTDDDLKAIFSYLQSIPAIKNQVPAPKVTKDDFDKLGKSYDQLIKRSPAAPGSSR